MDGIILIFIRPSYWILTRFIPHSRYSMMEKGKICLNQQCCISQTHRLAQFLFWFLFSQRQALACISTSVDLIYLLEKQQKILQMLLMCCTLSETVSKRDKNLGYQCNRNSTKGSLGAEWRQLYCIIVKDNFEIFCLTLVCNF